MEQVASSRWDYDDNETAMAIWNFTIDFYRYSPDDGDFGADNGENEFVGFIDDASLFLRLRLSLGERQRHDDQLPYIQRLVRGDPRIRRHVQLGVQLDR